MGWEIWDLKHCKMQTLKHFHCQNIILLWFYLFLWLLCDCLALTLHTDLCIPVLVRLLFHRMKSLTCHLWAQILSPLFYSQWWATPVSGYTDSSLDKGFHSSPSKKKCHHPLPGWHFLLNKTIGFSWTKPEENLALTPKMHSWIIWGSQHFDYSICKITCFPFNVI